MGYLPIIGGFTDTNGLRWAFDKYGIFAIENGHELHLYREHDFDIPTADLCAQLLGLKIQSAETYAPVSRDFDIAHSEALAINAVLDANGKDPNGNEVIKAIREVCGWRDAIAATK